MSDPYKTGPDLQGDSGSWRLFVWISFCLALSLCMIGVLYLPVDWWIRGYFGMGILFLTASTLMLSKTLRDQHEHERLVNRVKNARTEQVLSQFDRPV